MPEKLKKCPQCGKPLTLTYHESLPSYGSVYTHWYSLRQIASDKPICDYSERVEENDPAGAD